MVLTTRFANTTQVKGMTKISTSHFTSAFIPSSWTSPINDDIQKIMVLAYDKIILKSLLFGLKGKAKSIVSQQGDQEITIEPTSYTFGGVGSSVEFIRLKNTVDALEKLSHNVNLFNELKESQDLSKLGTGTTRTSGGPLEAPKASLSYRVRIINSHWASPNACSTRRNSLFVRNFGPLDHLDIGEVR